VLQWEAPSLYSGFADAAQRAIANLGSVLYVRLQLLLPHSWLADESTAIIESEGLWVLPFLEATFGPVDSVAAHTRALLRTDRPTEDIALAHLEFVGGEEGTIELHALGEEAIVKLEVYGPRGSIRVERDLHSERLLGLRRQYQGLRELAKSGDWQPMDSVVEAVSLARWLRQSARHGVRLYRRDKERS
jgi:predicted dehydrogenase